MLFPPFCLAFSRTKKAIRHVVFYSKIFFIFLLVVCVISDRRSLIKDHYAFYRNLLRNRLIIFFYMNQIQSYIQPLQEICQTRPRSFRNPSPHSSLLNAALYALDFKLSDSHNATSFFFTISFKTVSTIPDDWHSMISFIHTLKNEISRNYLVAGGFIGIEPHRNTTLFKKTGKNTRAGKPHLHMVLWFYNDFLSPDINYFLEIIDFHKIQLQKTGLNVKMKRCKTHLDTLKASLYTMKERDNTHLQAVCNHAQIPEAVQVWANNSDTRDLFYDLQKRLDNVGFHETLYSNTPTTRKTNDPAIQLGELFSKYFLRNGMAVFDNHVYYRVNDTHFSWKKGETLTQWIDSIWDLKLPTRYLEMLKNNSAWIATQGNLRRQDCGSVKLFPQLSIDFSTIEFSDFQ